MPYKEQIDFLENVKNKFLLNMLKTSPEYIPQWSSYDSMPMLSL